MPEPPPAAPMAPAAAPPRSAAERLAAERARARDEADAALREAGLSPDGTGGWTGALTVAAGATLPARVELPPAFPDALPAVFVVRDALPRRVAHVEESGRVCLAPTSGVLLDASRPAALVQEALARAVRTLGAGLEGRTDDDLRREFLAYWLRGVPTVLSICDPDGPPRSLTRIRTSGFGGVAPGTHLLADSREAAERWVQAVGTSAKPAGGAFFLPLATAPVAPDFDDLLSIRGALALFADHASPESVAALQEWLAQAGLPATIVLSLPEMAAGEERPLVTVTLPAPSGDAAKQAAAGFRPERVPTARRLAFAAHQPASRSAPVRLDHPFLAARGGTSRQLAASAVTLVGAGAVGSEIAQHLAALGVGRLHIVDPDGLQPENVHRHALGVAHLKQKKANALCDELGRRFPHLEFEAVLQRAEDVLVERPALFSEVGLVIFATGEETVERRLTNLLADGPPRVHAWVEPLGIGGHALAWAPSDGAAPMHGCYECLFETREGLGLVNRAALTAPGQEIRRSLAGCAGTFSPFSALDARRTALEAAELAGRWLRGGEREATLVTWRGDRTDFEAAGFRLSGRARVVAPGQRVATPGGAFARADCPVCGAAPAPVVPLKGEGAAPSAITES